MVDGFEVDENISSLWIGIFNTNRRKSMTRPLEALLKVYDIW